MIHTINHGSIRELRLNRPPVNALTGDLIAALREAVESAPKNEVRALVLSGTPGRFCAGLDVPLLMGLDRKAITTLWRELYALMKALACSPIPICAAIIGHAPAGGTVLPLFCDWRIMADGEFKIGLNEVQVGIPLPAVILAALRRQVGPRQAERLSTTGLLMSPAQALEIGLVDELVPTERVVERSVEWCKAMTALPVEAMTATRHEARADLIAIFHHNLEPELKKVSASWWQPETQATLRAVVDRLKKKY